MSRPTAAPRPVALIGAGRLGTALGRALRRSRDYRLQTIACSTAAAARRAARRIGAGRPATSATAAATEVRLVILCVPDRAIPTLARELARARPSWRGRTVLHTSGLLDATALAPLTDAGAAVGSMHPLQSFAGRRGDAVRLRHCWFGIEGTPAAVRTARRLVRAFDGRAAVIPAGWKDSYHLVACLLSNYLVSLVSMGIDLLPGRGVSRQRWIDLFAPLMSGTLDNLVATTPERALTGPVSRGDLVTLQRHLQRLQRAPAELLDLHRLLALRAVALARRGNRVDAGTAAAMRRLLHRSSSRKPGRTTGRTTARKKR